MKRDYLIMALFTAIPTVMFFFAARAPNQQFGSGSVAGLYFASGFTGLFCLVSIVLASAEYLKTKKPRGGGDPGAQAGGK